MTHENYTGIMNIPHSQPSLGQKEAEAAGRVIMSAYIAQGKEVFRFEQALAARIGVPCAVSTSSGTAALHLTLLAMGIGPGDQVIIPSYVCTSLLHAVNYTGAEAVLAEIIPETYNMSPEDVEKKINPRSKAIILPHMFGAPADTEAFLSFNIPLVEDCAQSLGGMQKGKMLGSIAHAAVFSFYANKVITTGEGGMVLSRSEDLTARIRDLRDYDNKTGYKIRYNYKMTDIQAAVGLVQLQRLDEFTTRRKNIAEQYYQYLNHARTADAGIRLPHSDPGRIYYRFPVEIGKNADALIRNMQKQGIACPRPVHCPLHRCLEQDAFPQTEKIWKNTVSLPIYPKLSDAEVRYTAEMLMKLAAFL